MTETSGHLPECLNDDDTYGLRGLCICDELRACEQRVLAEREADGPWFRSVVHDCCVDKQTAYAAGLDAAREAVAGLPEVAGWTGELAIIRKPIALDAIDALREKP